MQPDALVALPPPNSETLVDGEQAVLSLVLGWGTGSSRLHRDDLRLVDPVGVPFVDDGGGAARERVLEPVCVWPVRERDDEPVVGRHRDLDASPRRKDPDTGGSVTETEPDGENTSRDRVVNVACPTAMKPTAGRSSTAGPFA